MQDRWSFSTTLERFLTRTFLEDITKTLDWREVKNGKLTRNTEDHRIMLNSDLPLAGTALLHSWPYDTIPTQSSIHTRDTAFSLSLSLFAENRFDPPEALIVVCPCIGRRGRVALWSLMKFVHIIPYFLRLLYQYVVGFFSQVGLPAKHLQARNCKIKNIHILCD